MNIAVGLAVAWRIVRGDAAAIRAIPATSQVARDSFLAALVALPFYIVVVLNDPTPDPRDGETWLLREALLYPISWMAFPIAAFAVARAQGRGTEFMRYLAAYNWVQAYAYGLLAAILLLGALGVWAEVIQILAIGAFILSLAWSWFIARIGMDVKPMIATLLVAIDFVISHILNSLS